MCGILRPTWEELLAGARPLPPEAADPGEWQHGWQYCASSASEHYFRENVFACPRSGRSTEITCREAGATVRRNVKLRDMNVHLDPSDEREVEVLAAGLPIRHGAQLAIDITLRSVLICCGAPRPNAAAVDGAILTQVRCDKEA